MKNSNTSNRSQVTQTELTKKTADILNRTIYGKQEFDVTRYGRVVAEIKPKVDEEKSKSDLATK
jgi:hypothetical protein